MERTFTNQQGDKPCFICGKIIPVGEESTWDRSPAKRGYAHITCMAEKNVAERNGNGAATKGAGWMDGLADAILPYIEDKIAGKTDKTEVEGIVKKLLEGAVLLQATTVTVNDAKTSETKDMGLQHARFPKLLRLVKNRKNVWLTGPAGSGKTTAVSEISKALGTRFLHIGALDNEYKIMGFFDINGQVVSTIFRDWWLNGGTLCLDEIDSWLPSASLALNNALANGHCAFPDGMKKGHPDRVAVACANTYGLSGTDDYCGRMKQDKAFLDRFLMMDWPYDEAFELALYGSNAAWVKRVQHLRRNAKAKGLRVIISPRASRDGADLLADGLDQEFVEEVCVRKGMTEEHWRSIQ